MEIDVDLVSDWSNYLSGRLDALAGGIKKKNPTPADICKAFFNAALRRIPASPRKSHIPQPPFNVPCELANGYELVLQTSEIGSDLLPFQSTSLLLHDGLDGMLFDWGIYHLHLGEGPHPSKPEFKSRTGPLLYVMVTANDLYQIAVKPHGEWHCLELLNTVERNWPHMLDHAKCAMSITNPATTDEEVKLMRDAQLNMAIRLSSGNIYSFLGSGIAMSGEAFGATRAMVNAHRILEGLSKEIKKRPDALEKAMVAGGYDVPGRAVVRLVVNPTSVKIVEEANGIVLHQFTRAEEIKLFGGPNLSSLARNL